MKGDFDTLIASIYDAALDFSLWPTVLDSAASRFSASRAIVYTPLVAPPDGGFFASHNIAPGALETYDAHFRGLDLWTIGHQNQYAGVNGGFTGDMFVRYDALTKSEFYADFLRPQGLHHLCTSVVHERPGGGQVISFAMFRGPRQLEFSEHERLLSERLTPHMQRALVISNRLRECEVDRRINASMLDSAPSAVFLVNSAAKVLRLTQAGELLARTATHLRIRHNQLVSVTKENHFGEAIRSVTAADAREPFSRVLVIHGGEPPSRLHVLVVKAGMHLPGCAYVVVGPVATLREAGFVDRARAVYGLTPAEGRLCEVLKDGHSIDETASRLLIKRSTAVSQLKSVFSKTATSRQSELMRILIDLAGL